MGREREERGRDSHRGREVGGQDYRERPDISTQSQSDGLFLAEKQRIKNNARGKKRKKEGKKRD